MSVSRGLVTMLLSAVMLSGITAQAMEIQQFDKMAIPDQGDYVARLLQGAQKILVDTGKGEQALKLNKLFTDIPPGNQMSIGMLQFEENLDRARILDAERYAKDHNAIRLEVEHAMLVTLKKSGIVLPESFMHVADTFRPKLPLR